MKSLSVSSDFLGKNKPVSCGLARSVSGKTPGDFYDRRTSKPEQFVRPGPRKTEDAYLISSPGKPTLGTQGKIKLVKETSLSRQSKDSNPYATLPRASSVISTAEGTTRRTSIHDFLTKDSRLPISVDSPPATADSSITAASSEYLLHQWSSHTLHTPIHAVGSHAQNDLATDKPKSLFVQARHSRTEKSHFQNQTFAIISMSNDAFGISAKDSSVQSFTVAHPSQPFLSLNTELVSNISGLPPRPITRVTDQASASLDKATKKDNEQLSDNQSPSSSNPQSSADSNNLSTPACFYPDDTEAALVSEDNQTVWYEYGCV